MSTQAYGPTSGVEDFRAGLDPTRWIAAYLPAWSSRAAARAEWSTTAQGLTLAIPPEHPVWCAGDHDPPLRVSAIQSGNWSGPVGSMQGQQPFRSGQLVREAQPTLWGLTPHHGRVEVTCRATLTPESMFSAWLIGLEDHPDRCGEICLVEVFGSSVESSPMPSVELGRGVHAFRDPALREEFSAPRTPIDVAREHTYGVDWRADGVSFLLDGEVIDSVDQSPNYPMQLIIAIFEFPSRTEIAASDRTVPELSVREVRVDRR
ncbi:glycoside hydrolase family 16 protein [Gordonia sp. OPL2]|uniref:glycoside hydrolase family 16 protein n=1 Tax=Gordonia sp. OPL2 TaxID=2486274 RepID=UPI001655EF19|nr:glycoside hydrolase family 16 protein [Gordonia sp. OPL2]ROZ85967.1 glycosyl hydrolase family protein [Gordonia sp. OPL2]